MRKSHTSSYHPGSGDGQGAEGGDPAVTEPGVKRIPMAEFRPSGVQPEIFARGLDGERPAYPLTSGDLDAAARATLGAEAFAYVAGAAGEERTVDANRAAFERYRIVPG